ncbi:hypothetical protein U5801_29455, partial [Lamprobacter modestohalophilus]|nr:hypothetical protein [Lamprobacter modestohalophilus]
EERKAARNRVEQSRKAAGERLRAELEALKCAEQTLRAEIQTLDEQYRHAVEHQEAQQVQARRALEHERQVALDAHDQEQAERQARQREERIRIKKERDQALGEAGIDTTTLHRLEQERADTERA